MRAITAPKDMLEICSELDKNGETVGLVPTMGALHDGHLALVKQSLRENTSTVVSIFVNPLQFDRDEDLNNYPKSIDSDTTKLEALGVDLLFMPEVETFYISKPLTLMSFGKMERVLEGKFRPGHFGGVGVVVCKLFHTIKPDKAYFGLKDLQQFLLIKQMTSDLGFPVEIVGVETRREASGLAMSSRNQRLSAKGKDIASNIYKGLKSADELIRDRKDLNKVRESILSFYSSINGLEVEYLELTNGVTLKSLHNYNEISELAVCFAGYVEGVRLIDNLYLRLNS